MRTREQQRRLVAGRVDRRQDRDIDIARLGAEQRLGVLLAAGRDRVDVEEIGIAGQMRRDRPRGFEARSGGDGGDDDVGAARGVRRRACEPRADALAGLLERRAFGCGKQDVPGGDRFEAGVAQSGGDGLAGFAEADEAEAGGVVVRHGVSCGVGRVQSIAEADGEFQVVAGSPIRDCTWVRRSANILPNL